MYQQSLSSIMHKSGANARGLCKILAAPKEGILSMPDFSAILTAIPANDAGDFFAEEIILKDDYQWLDISNDANLRIKFSEEEKPTAQGKLLTYTAEIILPNDDFETRGKIIRAYDNREWVLLVKERTGAWRVMGSTERGAVFSAQLNTGSVQEGANQHNCAFTWQSGTLRAYYTCAFPEDNFFRIQSYGTDNGIKIEIDEPVLIVTTGGATKFYYTPISTPQTITLPCANAGLNEFTVYHRNLATGLKMNYESGYNSEISIINHLPSTLQSYELKNSGSEAPVGDGFSHFFNLVNVRLEGNAIGTTLFEAILVALDNNAHVSGLVNLSDQTPPAMMSPTAAAAKGSLEDKSWTVTV